MEFLDATLTVKPPENFGGGEKQLSRLVAIEGYPSGLADENLRSGSALQRRIPVSLLEGFVIVLLDLQLTCLDQHRKGVSPRTSAGQEKGETLSAVSGPVGAVWETLGDDHNVAW